MSYVVPLRADLQGLTPYGAPQLDVPVRLNVNENPYSPSETVIADITADVVTAVDTAARGLNRYPDRDALELREALAGFLGREAGVAGLDASRLWAANGSNEVLLQICQAFGGPGRAMLSFAPTYSMYPEYARDSCTGWLTEPREADFTLDPARAVAAVRRHKPSITVIASPNNPTGTSTPLAVVEAICRATDGVVVIDEAYGEFRREGVPSAVSLLATLPNLIVCRTMSKAFGMAGARLGYAAAAPEIVAALMLVRLPYHLSAITQAVAGAALRHADELMAQVGQLRRERDATQEWLIESGFTVVPSDANFVFFGQFEDRHAIWQGLLEHGVLVRETGPDGWLRVSIGTPEEMTAFREALKAVYDR